MKELRKIEGFACFSWNELRYAAAHGCLGGHADPESKLDLWLHMNGLHLQEDQEETDVVRLGQGDDTHYMLRKNRWPRKAQFRATNIALMSIIKHDMAFLDDPAGEKKGQGLIALPRESMRIGWRRYMLPGPMLANITYQQYSNAVKLLREADGIIGEFREAEEKQDTAAMASVAVRMKQAMARAVSHLLTPRSLRVTNRAGGAVRMDVKWEYAYDPEVAERNVNYIARHAPQELYSILSLHLQSCLVEYRRQYPDMFSGGDKDDDRMPFIAEADSVNAVMKWQSYSTQQEVYDSNAVFIFSILSAMAKESKEMEKLNSKTRGKRV